MPHKNQPTWWYVIGGLALLILISISGWLYLRVNHSGTAASTDDVSAAIARMMQSGSTSTTGDGFTITTEPVAGAAPSLDRTIPATPDLDAQARTLLVAKITTTVAALKKNPQSYPDWLDLGIERQAAGDYEGAHEAWSYAGAISPNAATPFGNLGYLYLAYLKDDAQSESNYKRALANDPKNPQWYRALNDLYAISKPTAQEQLLKEAIAKFPTALDFQVLLARWYRDHGRALEARAEYDVAISTANKEGNTQASTQLKAEKAAVK